MDKPKVGQWYIHDTLGAFLVTGTSGIFVDIQWEHTLHKGEKFYIFKTDFSEKTSPHPYMNTPLYNTLISQ